MRGAAHFGPDARLSSGRNFQRVFTDGRKSVGRQLILWHVPASHENSTARIGLSVPGKVGGAILRNRLKRLVREAFRLNRPRLAPGDYVAYLRQGCRWSGLPEAETDFLDLCRKAGTLRP